jgi:DNA invertase Pin-like site-specific DNA recombinase
MARRKAARRDVTSGARLVGYVRVSSEEQARHGISLAAQRDRIAAYATAMGLELVGIEEDGGVSGAAAPSQRPGLGRALAALRRGEAAGLVVLKLDRLSRSTRHTLDLVDDCQRRGWRLVSLSESLDTGSAAGRLVLTVLAALGQMEREQVGERTACALAQVAREGRIRSRIAPFGFRVIGGGTTAIAGGENRLEEVEAEQVILRRIGELSDDGLGARRIAATLNAEGIQNPRTGGTWTHGNVGAVLRTAWRRANAQAA